MTEKKKEFVHDCSETIHDLVIDLDIKERKVHDNNLFAHDIFIPNLDLKFCYFRLREQNDTRSK